MNKEEDYALPLDIRESMLAVEESKKIYDEDTSNVLLKVDLEKKLTDLSLTCKWHRAVGDMPKDFLDELETCYWSYLK